MTQFNEILLLFSLQKGDPLILGAFYFILFLMVITSDSSLIMILKNIEENVKR